MSANTKPKIVVGVSGSNASTAALSWAADEADRQHGQLTVIFCWSADHLAYYAHPSQEDPGLRQERARRDLAATIHAVLGPAQNNATTEIVTGTVERARSVRRGGSPCARLGRRDHGRTFDRPGRPDLPQPRALPGSCCQSRTLALPGP